MLKTEETRVKRPAYTTQQIIAYSVTALFLIMVIGAALNLTLELDSDLILLTSGLLLSAVVLFLSFNHEKRQNTQPSTGLIDSMKVIIPPVPSTLTSASIEDHLLISRHNLSVLQDATAALRAETDASVMDDHERVQSRTRVSLAAEACKVASTKISELSRLSAQLTELPGTDTSQRQILEQAELVRADLDRALRQAEAHLQGGIQHSLLDTGEPTVI